MATLNTLHSGNTTKEGTSLSKSQLHLTDIADSRFAIGCAHREVNNRDTSIDTSVRRAPSAQLQLLFDQGYLFEASVFATLESLHKVTSLRDQGADIEGATIRAMDRGDRIIIGPTLPAINHRSGRPDVLIRHSDKKMDNGKWAYIPVDVKNSKPLDGSGHEMHATSTLQDPWFENQVLKDIGIGKPKEDHNLQLAHYWLMLLDLGYAPDIAPVGGIIDNDNNLTWMVLDDGDESPLKTLNHEWTLRWNAVLAMRDDLQACTRPVYKQECQNCVWHDVCEAELVQEQHVSLLPGVTVSHVAKLAETGITATPQLAALDPATSIAANNWKLEPSLSELFTIASGDSSMTLSELPKMSNKRLDKLQQLGITTVTDLLALDPATLAVPKYKALSDNIDTARVHLLNGKYPFYPRDSSVPVIPRADIEIDFDIENDDVVYLFGAYVSRKKPDGSYDAGEYVSFHFFNRDDPDEEGRQFAAFWSWIHQLLNEASANGKTANIYCYSGKIAELPRMREASTRNAHVAGVPTPDEITELGAAPHWVDLYEISKPLLWPTRRTSLKDVAKLAGFSWHATDAGGGNSIVWYQIACGLAPGDADDMQDKLLTYNEDDVRATLVLRHWLSDGVAGNGWTLASVETLSH